MLWIQKSEWSANYIFGQTVPTTINVNVGEELSLVLPYKNVDISNYKMTLSYNANELELIDACEMTPTIETVSTYINNIKTYIVITQNNNMVNISYLLDESADNNNSGVVTSIRLKSKKTGTASISYGVTKK